MKILHIHPSMAGGGIESMICALSNEMAKSEDVTVCSIFVPIDTDIFWHKLSPSVKKISLGKDKKGMSIKILFKILKTIKHGQYDVVNIHGMFYYYFLSVLLLNRKVKFFYTIHSDALKENCGWDKQIFPIKKFCFKKGFMHPITISNVSQKSFFDLYHCKSDLIYNGVNKPCISEDNTIRNFRITNRTRVFMHAGRIDAPKNQLVLCKVFKQLVTEGYDVVLIIAGAKKSSSIFEDIKKYFCERIIYIGERNDVLQLLAYSDAMCLPSIWEGLPITLLESLSVGCIPICSKAGGIPNVIEHGYNGFLSSSPSMNDYYDTVKTFLTLSPNKFNEIRRNCIESFKKYDISNTSKSYLNLYKH